MTLEGVKVGDPVWILSGRRNRAFKATVVTVADLIVVGNDDERNSTFGELLEFEIDTGLAYAPDIPAWKSEPPMLVRADDPRALEIERRRLHRAFRERINEAANTYKDQPTAQNYTRLIAVAEAWNKNSIGRDFNEHTIEQAIRN